MGTSLDENAGNPCLATSPAYGKLLELSLNWKFRQIGTNKWHDASVPGNNFSDLRKLGIIGDPFFRANENELQWIEKLDWEYLHEFNLPEEDLDFDKIILVLDGLDTYADVYFNDNLLVKASNMFVQWKTDVKNVIKPGSNRLKVVLRSPLEKVVEKAARAGLLYPAENDHSEENLSVYTRKAPYHYGWDWGPRFVCSGIWRPVWLKFYRKASIENIHVRQQLQENAARLQTTWDMDATTDCHAKLVISCINENIDDVERHIDLTEGGNKVSLDFEIENYKKWWPRPLGNPHLYEFRFALIMDGEEVDSKIHKLGLRKLEVINEPDDDGVSFYFKVNDIPFFAKGANYVPQDSFQDAVTKARYEKIFEDAAGANMNMLRVWGGGIYEEDIFYDLADEYGILIWQDFMFACTMYPGDSEFLDSVGREAVYNIKRLRNHPSIALWCGNNEISVGWKHWGWQEKFSYSQEQQDRLSSDYNKIFEELLPSQVNELDPDRFYLSSSPTSYFEDAESFKTGDNHYWGVWHKEAPFEDFEKSVPRFMSEYGFQSFPIRSSLKRYTDKSDRDFDSEVMKLHQKHPRGNQLIEEYLLRDYHEPENFEAFLYASQVLQAEGMKIGIEAHRRNRPFCMGTLYWQLNDCWPAASWSGIDYYGQWKALHYKVKDGYSDILICAEMGPGVRVFIVSDLNIELKGDYILEVKNFSGGTLFFKKGPTIIKGGESRVVFSESKEVLLNGNAANTAFLSLKVVVNDKIISSNVYYFVKPKQLDLSNPSIDCQINRLHRHYEVRLLSTVLVKNLHLEFDEMQGNFSDNFFDLLPYEEKVVRFPALEKSKVTPTLRLFSLVEMSV